MPGEPPSQPPGGPVLRRSFQSPGLRPSHSRPVGGTSSDRGMLASAVSPPSTRLKRPSTPDLHQGTDMVASSHLRPSTLQRSTSQSHSPPRRTPKAPPKTLGVRRAFSRRTPVMRTEKRLRADPSTDQPRTSSSPTRRTGLQNELSGLWTSSPALIGDDNDASQTSPRFISAAHCDYGDTQLVEDNELDVRRQEYPLDSPLLGGIIHDRDEDLDDDPDLNYAGKDDRTEYGSPILASPALVSSPLYPEAESRDASLDSLYDESPQSPKESAPSPKPDGRHHDCHCSPILASPTRHLVLSTPEASDVSFRDDAKSTGPAAVISSPDDHRAMPGDDNCAEQQISNSGAESTSVSARCESPILGSLDLDTGFIHASFPRLSTGFSSCEGEEPDQRSLEHVACEDPKPSQGVEATADSRLSASSPQQAPLESLEESEHTLPTCTDSLVGRLPDPDHLDGDAVSETTCSLSLPPDIASAPMATKSTLGTFRPTRLGTEKSFGSFQSSVSEIQSETTLVESPSVGGAFTADRSAVEAADETAKPQHPIPASASPTTTDVEDNSDQHRPTSSGPSIGFTTARGSSLPPPSAQALAMAHNLLSGAGSTDSHSSRFASEDTPSVPAMVTTGSRTTSGFQTARGHSLPTPSAESMKRARDLLSDSSDTDTLRSPPKRQNQGTGPPQPPSSSSSVFSHPDTTLSAKFLEGAICEEPSGPGTFMTASGKHFPKLSGAALERAQRIFADADDSHAEQPVKLPSKGPPQTPLRTSRPVFKTPTRMAPKSNVQDSVDPAAESMGAYTHDKAASQAPSQSPTRPATTPSMSSAGFSTAKGRLLPPPSREALRQAEALLSSGSPAETDRKPMPSTPTARKVAPSAAASATRPPVPSLAPAGSPLRLGGYHSDPLKALPTTPKTPVSRAIGSQNKPFKSPLTARSRNLANPPTSRSYESPRRSERQEIPQIFDVSNSAPRQSWKECFTEVKLDNIDGRQALPDDILRMNSVLSKTHKFVSCSGESLDAEAITQELIKRGCQASLLTTDWVMNHYRSIVWKLACMVRQSPRLQQSYWNIEMVVSQLLYRYQREVNMAHRSALKLAVERDHPASAHMVLCVSRASPELTPGRHLGLDEIELTDGWYFIMAKLDQCLAKALRDKKIFTGLKLHVQNAKLIGAGTDILNTDGAVSLQLNANSVRRAAWDAKLGLQRQRLFVSGLASLSADGGSAGCVDVVVCRVYPILYLDKSIGGRNIIRNQKEEDIEQRRWEMQQSKAADGSFRRFGGGYENEPPLHSAQDGATAPAQTMDIRERRRRFDALLGFSEGPDHGERNVTSFVNIRICDYPPEGTSPDEVAETMLTIWTPSLDQLAEITEGTRLQIYNIQCISPNRVICKNTSVVLKASRQISCRIRPTTPERLARSTYLPRSLFWSSELAVKSHGDEVDMVLVVERMSQQMPVGFGDFSPKLETLIMCYDREGTPCEIQMFGYQSLSSLKGIVHFRNLEYIAFQQQRGCHRLRGNSETEISTAFRSGPASERREALEQWMNENPGKVQEVKEAVELVLGRNNTMSTAAAREPSQLPTPTIHMAPQNRISGLRKRRPSAAVDNSSPGPSKRPVTPATTPPLSKPPTAQSPSNSIERVSNGPATGIPSNGPKPPPEKLQVCGSMVRFATVRRECIGAAGNIRIRMANEMPDPADIGQMALAEDAEISVEFQIDDGIEGRCIVADGDRFSAALALYLGLDDTRGSALFDAFVGHDIQDPSHRARQEWVQTQIQTHMSDPGQQATCLVKILAQTKVVAVGAVSPSQEELACDHETWATFTKQLSESICPPWLEWEIEHCSDTTGFHRLLAVRLMG